VRSLLKAASWAWAADHRSWRWLAGVRPFVGIAAPRVQRISQTRHVCEAASIQFIRGVDEPTVPEVALKRARTGTSGQALFVFDNPSIFQASSELGDITGNTSRCRF